MIYLFAINFCLLQGIILFYFVDKKLFVHRQQNFNVFEMFSFAPASASSFIFILICSFDSINYLEGSPVVNRDMNLTLDYLEETDNQNSDDTLLKSGLPAPVSEEETGDNSKTIIIVVVVMVVFILFTIFNHVIVPKVCKCKT